MSDSESGSEGGDSTDSREFDRMNSMVELAERIASAGGSGRGSSRIRSGEARLGTKILAVAVVGFLMNEAGTLGFVFGLTEFTFLALVALLVFVFTEENA